MVNITGTMIYYWFVCHRKLWYFLHNIQLEENSEDVAIGRTLDQESFRRQSKHITIDNTISIDFISQTKEIHEIKKSRKIEDAGIWQVKYYLWYMKQKGINISKGVINYPLLKQTVEVFLGEEDEKKIKTICKDIEFLYYSSLPPLQTQTSICNKCAYKDLCLI